MFQDCTLKKPERTNNTRMNLVLNGSDENHLSRQQVYPESGPAGKIDGDGGIHEKRTFDGKNGSGESYVSTQVKNRVRWTDGNTLRSSEEAILLDDDDFKDF